MTTLHKNLDLVNNFFGKEQIQNLMDKYGVIKRKREIEPQALLRTLLKNSLMPNASISSLVETLNYDEKIEISRQGMHKKIAHCEGFSAQLLNMILNKNKPTYDRASEVKSLKDILIVDSSEINKKEKIQLIYSVQRQKIAHIDITKVNQNDQGYRNYLDFVKSNMLLIADLGYFALDSLTEIADKCGCFLFRYFKRTSIYSIDDNKININKFLSCQNKDIIDRPILLGSSKIPCRLICLRLSQSQLIKRNQNIHKKKQRDQRLKKRNEQTDKWNIFVTNLSVTEFKPKLCYELYASRWQIELLFKAIKSGGLHINKSDIGTKLGKVMFHFKLMLAVLIFQMNNEKDRNVSIIKLLTRIPVIIVKNIEKIGKWTISVIKEIQFCIKKFCKCSTYKNRKTSYEKVRSMCLS